MPPTQLIITVTTIGKKKFLRLIYSSKALKLEEEELQEEDDFHGKQFAKDFDLENQFFIASQSSKEVEHTVVENQNTENNHDIDVKKKEIDPLAKKIHRALARATHPDLHKGPESVEDFKQIQEAYEMGDISGLLLKAFDLEIDVDLDMHDLAKLEKKISIQRNSLQEIKNTMKWAWAQSDKSSIARRKIQIALGINPEKFEEWVRKKSGGH